MEIEFNNSHGPAIEQAIDSDSNNLLTSPVIRKDDDSSSDYDDDDVSIDSIGTPYHSNHHLYAPLEITSRPAAVIIPNRTTNFFGIRRKKIKIILVLFIIAVTILVASLVETRTTTAIPEQPTRDEKDDDNDDEPNPPVFPESIKLFHPPKNEIEARELQTIIQQSASDPILTREDEFSANNDKTSPSKSDYAQPTTDYTYTTANHFSSTHRIALLFSPGTYPIDFEVGYYTSIHGLGIHPTDVAFANVTKGPHVPALDKYTNRPPNGSGLDTFWRSIENIATYPHHGMRWTVSQAAPLRRMHIGTNLDLYDGDAWVSGGVVANVVVEGRVNFGGQQQWLMRNVDLRGGEVPVGGAWSLVFVGCVGDVPREFSGMMMKGGGGGAGAGAGPSISVEDDVDLRVEKPYIVMKEMGRRYRNRRRRRRGSMIREGEEGREQPTSSEYYHRFTNGTNPREEVEYHRYRFELRVPAATFGRNATGPQFEDGSGDGIIRDFRRVKLGVPSNSTDPTEAAVQNHKNLQKALDEGKDLVISPGIYPVSDTLNVKYANQVILGLGYATLVAPRDGSPCILVHPRVPGVRIAGIMLEASKQKGKTNSGRTASPSSSSLLQWGTPAADDDPGDARNPGVLSDVYARVGGVHRDVSTDVMIRLHSGNVYGDNLWLWRADHVQLRPKEEPNFPQISGKYRQTERGECEVKNGLVVEAGASNVTIVGLAVEHATEDQIVWNGEYGQVYFYQSEFPYDVDHSYADNKFAGYRVGPNVENHKAVGLGIYSNFRDYDVKVGTAVVHPANGYGSRGIQLRNMFTVKLDNKGKIGSIVNGRGPGPTVDSEKGHPYRCLNETCSGSEGE
eukprot:CAMPEP_0201662778 /NCGR_PEP_ID=MMETSP0494-20130426/4782_1 /ASSEMBLY_ACC=CAM_ASM_000839 /TAXON_ID=420259 /ORGANISM="Thalassiosira gravida, Strain GMp14c1" /LENGTH=847 /DNA_ID=CAMNT_0048141231 /DNA_START=69 /DNA_END=2612 /DNA_ORIENTATION=+